MIARSGFERLARAAHGQCGSAFRSSRMVGARAKSKAVQGGWSIDEGRGDGGRELLIARDGYSAGKSIREIAQDLFGAEVVVADWDPDSGVRARTRRLLHKARVYAERG